MESGLLAWINNTAQGKGCAHCAIWYFKTHAYVNVVESQYANDPKSLCKFKHDN